MRSWKAGPSMRYTPKVLNQRISWMSCTKCCTAKPFLNADQITPAWLTIYFAELCFKYIKHANIIDNYRPLSFLPPMWILLTGIEPESVYEHLENVASGQKSRGPARRTERLQSKMQIYHVSKLYRQNLM